MVESSQIEAAGELKPEFKSLDLPIMPSSQVVTFQDFPWST